MALKKGVVSNWHESKGFGFIVSDGVEKDIFFHINDFSKKHKMPVNGLKVNYVFATDNNSRTYAKNVLPKNGHVKTTVARTQLRFSLFLTFIFYALLIILVYLKSLPVVVLYVYLGMSFLLFLLYAKDKSAAKKGKWRTPESTLHLFSILGGWPGGTLAQSFLRHKSKKLSFRIYFWLTVILNCAGLAWSLTNIGEGFLNIFFENMNF